VIDGSRPPVSRETGPPPAGASIVFGSQLPVAERFAAWLAEAGIERGLIGPREVPRLWDRHVLNCAVIGEVIGHGEKVADIGSGAGLPGIALAIARPDLDIVLIEPMLRRTEFLDETVALLELPRVSVVRSRAEEFPVSNASFDVVTARAVAKVGHLAALSAPLLRPGGRLVALKGESVHEELRKAQAAMKKAGASSWSVESVGKNVVDPATLVAVVTMA
jgi:16S rRNA (guanine527-N7)-methyltransferase